MPKNRKKSGKRKSLRELFKIGSCTSPETISPEIDDTVQNGQDNGDIVEEHSITDIGDASKENRYSDGDATNTSEYNTDLAEQNKCDFDGDITPEYNTDLAEQNKCDFDGDITPEYNTDLAEQNKCDFDGDITPEYNTDLAEQNKCDSDGDITPEYNTDLAEQNKCDSDGDITPEYNTDLAEQNKCDFDGDIAPEQRVFDEQNICNPDVDSEQRRCMLDKMDTTYNEDDNMSIGVCSLSNSDAQIDFTSQVNHDTLSKGISGSLSGSVQRINITPNNENDTSNKEDGYLLNTEDCATSKKEDDVTSIGACSLSDTDEQMGRKHIDVKDDLTNSNDSRKQKDVKDNSNTSPKTGLYIDPMVMDSRKEILLNLKNLIQQNVKQIKDMRKCKAQLNIAVHKAELRVDRTKKSNDETKVKITTLRADFWLKAKQLPALVSLKVNKCDNWVRKRKQDIVDDLNTVKRKEKLLTEVIPKLIEENALRKTWTPTVPMITFSPVIAHLNLQFFEEFGTIFRFKKLRPGIYFRHPFYRTTYHVAEEKVENFKEKHPYFYYHCQRYIKKNDVEEFQQTKDVVWYDEKKQGLKEIKGKDIEKQHVCIDVKNKQAESCKEKVMNNETSLKIKRFDAKEMKYGQEDKKVIDGITGVKTQKGVTNTDPKTTKKKGKMRKENNNSTDRIVQNKNQAQTKITIKTILEPRVNVGKGKAIHGKVTIPKPRNSSAEKVKTDTSRSIKEITRNDTDKGKKNQKNMEVDIKILERIENLRKQGKDAFLKTTGDKSFIYIKPTFSKGIETESDNNRHLAISAIKRGQSVGNAKVVRRPPSVPIKHAAMKRFGTTKQSNSLSDNIRVHAKPVPVKGKTKIPLFIRQYVDYKTPTPRKPPNSNVPSQRIHFTEGQSKSGVIQRKRNPFGPEPTIFDAFDDNANADRDKSNMDRQIPVSRNDITRDFTMPQTKTFNKFRKKSQTQSLIPISVNYMKEKCQRIVLSREPAPYGHIIARDFTMLQKRTFNKFYIESQKQRQSLIPISVNYMKEWNQRKVVSREPAPYGHIITQDKTKGVSKEPVPNDHMMTRNQNNNVPREPTPYDHVITQVISEYLPWSDDEDDGTYDNPEVDNMPKTNHNGIIPIKEKENQRTKETLEAKDKVKTNTSPLLQQGDYGGSIEPTLNGPKIVRDQSKDVFRESKPYDHIISQVISEYLPWSDEEDDAYDNPEVKEKPENSQYDTITVKEKETNRMRETLKSKGKVKSNLSLNFLEDDKAITKKSRNVILLPPITPTSSPTKRARSRSERCKSYKSKNQDKSNNDSLAVNVNSTLNERNSVSVTAPKNSVTDTNMSGKSLEGKNCGTVPRPQEKKYEMDEIVPHPPESPKDTSKRRGRKLRIGTGKEIEPIAAKISKPETNRASDEALLEHGIQSTAKICHDSFHSLSKSSASKSGKTLLENIDEKMLSSVMDEQFNSHRKSLRGQSELVLPPIRNH